jgi:REP element-mobilizing transposase RayT
MFGSQGWSEAQPLEGSQNDNPPQRGGGEPKTMPSTYTQLLYHLVLSTKDRRPLITEDMEPSLYAYRGGIIRSEKGVLLAAGGMPDHLHLLVRYCADAKLSDLLRTLKSRSSKWIHDEYTTDFSWQVGYAAFTVSQSGVPEVKKYIGNQKVHHKKRDFKVELITMLKLHEIEYDERYVFD